MPPAFATTSTSAVFDSLRRTQQRLQRTLTSATNTPVHLSSKRCCRIGKCTDAALRPGVGAGSTHAVQAELNRRPYQPRVQTEIASDRGARDLLEQPYSAGSPDSPHSQCLCVFDSCCRILPCCSVPRSTALRQPRLRAIVEMSSRIMHTTFATDMPADWVRERHGETPAISRIHRGPLALLLFRHGAGLVHAAVAAHVIQP
mmetsp:Transcript_38698/g.119609  ORF Transcript_38698/g.119609 Transcript_38698/m.119609 type:complete len:202 (+) Transcript_38698:105-710(+)